VGKIKKNTLSMARGGSKDRAIYKEQWNHEGFHWKIKLIQKKAYGFRNVENYIPITPQDTIFNTPSYSELAAFFNPKSSKYLKYSCAFCQSKLCNFLQAEY
jgi:hypothetical protein